MHTLSSLQSAGDPSNRPIQTGAKSQLVVCVASRFVLQRCCVGFQSWSRLTRTQVLSLVALGGGFSYSASHSPAVLSGSQRGGCDVYSSCFDCVADAACGFCPEPTPAHTAGEAGTGAVSGGEVATVTGYCIAGSAAAPVTAEAAGGGATAMCAVRISVLHTPNAFSTA